MKLALKPYSDYQDTSLPWASRVPAHWGITRLKYLVEERVEKGFPDEPLLTATQARGVIPKAAYGIRTVEAMKDLHLLKLVEPGDYVISLRSFQGGIEFAHDRGIISPAYTVLRPTPDVRRGYYEHFFKSPRFIGSMSLFVTGIREGQNIDYVRLSRAYMPVPPLEEQDAIGRFIRYTDQRVNRLLKTKRRLIELLNEQKQAIIHRAVTQGLDPVVPLKPSGVEWLGDVPSHWEVKRFKYCASIVTGQVDPKDYSFKYLPLVAPNHIEAGTGRIIAIETADEQGAQSGKYQFKRGDVLYSKIRPKLRKACFAEIDGLCSADMYPIRAKLDLLQPQFLVYLLLGQPFSNYATELSMRVAMPKINREDMANFFLSFPSIEEQQSILEYLDVELAPLNEATAKTNSEIAFIREYRTRLVSEVVTGQLDVRGLTLPEMEDEPLVPEDADEELEEEGTDEAE